LLKSITDAAVVDRNADADADDDADDDLLVVLIVVQASDDRLLKAEHKTERITDWLKRVMLLLGINLLLIIFYEVRGLEVRGLED
jgi:hypothetical protein